nr:RNA-directed DNA polymerase, eukaryota [Tanacetum cinerariifolium]
MMGSLFLALFLPCAGMGVVFLVYMCLLCYAATHLPERPVSANKKTAKTGLSPAELDKLSKTMGQELGPGTECAVCLDEIEAEQPVRVVPWCNHGFHLKCADTWFVKNPVCPVCRNKLEPEKKNLRRTNQKEMLREISVAEKLDASLEDSLRRPVRGSLEQQQFSELSSIIESVSLSSSLDRWVCSMSSDGVFSVKEVRIAIDDLYLLSHSESTRWVKAVPIKVNIFVCRARRDCLPTRTNLVRRGVFVESSSCPLCFAGEEDVHHVVFRCSLSWVVLRRVCRWWNLDWQDWCSFSEWSSWLSSIRLPVKVKSLIEGVFYVAWWFIWGLRNRTIFYATPPTRSVIFDEIVSTSFHWCHSRCKMLFSWDDSLKNLLFNFLVMFALAPC